MSAHRNFVLTVSLLGLTMTPTGTALAARDAPATAGTEPTARPGPAVMRQWSRSCALCHVDGNAGAPRIGHPEEWRARKAQGRDVLLEHTIHGFNKMPPLGYCMSCEAEDFRALIEFMAGATE